MRQTRRPAYQTDDPMNPAGYQLPMFMSGQQVSAQFSPQDADRAFTNNPAANKLKASGDIDRGEWYKRSVETDEKVWQRKGEDWAGGNPSYNQSVVAQGVRNPVSLTFQRSGVTDKPMLGGGHHRVAAHLHEQSDKLMPVRHYETYTDARSDRSYS